jgi:hypothetical protein
MTTSGAHYGKPLPHSDDLSALLGGDVLELL